MPTTRKTPPLQEKKACRVKSDECKVSGPASLKAGLVFDGARQLAWLSR